MVVLGVDTATRTASVGLLADGKVLAERSCPVASSHAALLLSLIHDTLDSAGTRLRAVDLFAISIGPGSFTGVRVGLSTVKGLALATGRPIVGVATLTALAAAAGVDDGLIYPILDARKGEIYAAGFRRSGGELVAVLDAAVMRPEGLLGRLQTPCTLIGDGLDRYAEIFRASLGDAALLDASVQPRAAVVARLGGIRAASTGPDDLARLEPTYLRPPEAERNRALALSIPPNPAVTGQN